MLGKVVVVSIIILYYIIIGGYLATHYQLLFSYLRRVLIKYSYYRITTDYNEEEQ